MADFMPVAGVQDFQMSGVIEPAGARVDGNLVGAAYDEVGNEVVLPSGYSFFEESQLVTRLVCPTTADDSAAPDLIVGQKADRDLSTSVDFIRGGTFTVKTVPPAATGVTSSAGIVPKLP